MSRSWAEKMHDIVFMRFGVVVPNHKNKFPRFIKEIQNLKADADGKKSVFQVLKAELEECFDTLARAGKPPVSRQMIYNYLHETKCPQEGGRDTFEFMRHYIEHVAKNHALPDSQEVTYKRLKVEFTEKTEVNINTNRHYKSNGQFHNPNLIDMDDESTRSRATTLCGVYQIIRPSGSSIEGSTIKPKMTVIGNFVLEVLSINTNESDITKHLHMYSHKAHDNKLIYSGMCGMSAHSLFGYLWRHNPETMKKAFRTLVAYVHNCDACFSGLLTRSASGHSGMTPKAISVPFIAIKSPYKVEDFIKSPVVQINMRRPKIHSINKDLLIGELCNTDRTYRDLHHKINALFSFLNRQIHLDKIQLMDGGFIDHPNKDFVLSTAAPHPLETAIENILEAKDDYFERWRELVVAQASKAS